MKAEPSGFLVWFDPHLEHVRLFHGPPSDSVVGSREALELAEAGDRGYLDKVGSVSELEGEGESDVEERFEQGVFFEEEEPLPF